MFGIVVAVHSLWCPTLFDPVDCSMPGFPVLHYLLEFAQLSDFHFHFSDPWVSWGLIFLVCCLWILVRRDVQKSLQILKF